MKTISKILYKVLRSMVNALLLIVLLGIVSLTMNTKLSLEFYVLFWALATLWGEFVPSYFVK
jgi:hypothetical protein